jgi:pilus assembly protein CpaC
MQLSGLRARGCTGGGAIFKDYGVTLRLSPVVLAEGRILLHIGTEVTEIDNQTGQPVFGTFCARLTYPEERDDGGDTLGRFDRFWRASSNDIAANHQRPSGPTRPADSRCVVSFTRLSAAGDRTRDLVTPYILKPAQPNEIARPTDGFADASDPQTWRLGRINRLYAPSNPEAIKDYKGPVSFIQD